MLKTQCQDLENLKARNKGEYRVSYKGPLPPSLST